MINYLRMTGMSLVLALFMCSYSAHAENISSASLPPINQPPTSEQIPGKIIWHNLLTNDIKHSQEFYSKMFGWQFKAYQTGHDTYYLITYLGKSIGGIVPLTAHQEARNDNQWINYISVPDVAQSTQFVTRHGGKIHLNATLAGQQGELAVYTDPEGALFGVLNSTSGDPPDAQSQAGQWVWADLMVNKPKETIKFYQGLADYKVMMDARHPKATEYYLYKNKWPRAGVIPLPGGKHAPKILPNWLPYVYVSNISAAVVKTTSLGGRIILKPATQEYGGKIAIIADPGGAALGLVELAAANKRSR